MISLKGGPFNVSISHSTGVHALIGETPSNSAPAAFGRFEVLHQIGAGVLGPVFLARDPERARSVAIKVFGLDITSEQAAELVAQLNLLARANLAHPSIIVPFEAALEGTVAYLAEDYVAADSLDAAIRQYGPAPVSQAVRILTAVAGALDFAAAVGVHHGALHPRDLLVTPDDTRVTGLGVGRALEAVGLRAPMRRPYVAPERVQREGWDARADIYSLGVLARELLADRSRRAPAAQPPLSDDRAERLKSVLARATAARPADRFSTCFELVGALQDALAGASVRAVAAPRPGTKPTKPGHDLLLPLEDEEADESMAPDAGGVRLRLDDVEGVPDVGRAADSGPAAAEPAVPDLQLRDAAAPGADRPGDAFDLSDLDSRLTSEPASFEPDMPAGLADQDRVPPSIAEPQTAELGPPPDLPEPGERDEAGRFADVFESGPEPTFGEPLPAEPAPEEPLQSISALPEEPAVSAAPRPMDLTAPARPRSRALPLVAMLIVGIVLGAIAGYLVGVRRGAAAAPAASAQPAPTPGAPGATQTLPPSTQPGRPVQQAGPPASAAITSPLRPKATAGSGTGPARSAAASPVGGTLVIQSTPRGASVTLNGRARGATPLRLRNLPVGRYTIRVSRRGYTPEERAVVVSAERPTSTVAFTLARAGAAQPASRSGFYGTLSVESLPPGARVFVDGRLIGTTPVANYRVAAGSRVVRVDRTGFLPWTTTIQVVTGQPQRVTASLEREAK